MYLLCLIIGISSLAHSQRSGNGIQRANLQVQEDLTMEMIIDVVHKQSQDIVELKTLVMVKAF